MGRTRAIDHCPTLGGTVLLLDTYRKGGGGSTLQQNTSIPTTILVDEFGAVEKVWPGYLAPEEQKDLRETLAAMTKGRK